jgi:hypothetical protein
MRSIFQALAIILNDVEDLDEAHYNFIHSYISLPLIKGDRTPVTLSVFKENVRVTGKTFTEVLKKAMKNDASDAELQALVDHSMWHFCYM